MKKILFSLVLLAMLLPFAYAGEKDLLKDGDFENEMIFQKGYKKRTEPGWDKWIDKQWSGAGAIFVKDGVAVIEIKDPGTAPWAMAIHYWRIPMKKNKNYVLKFKAKADKERVIRLDMVDGYKPDAAPYMKYMDVIVGTEWQDYEIEFKMILASYKYCRLDFNCGNNPGMFLDPETKEDWPEEKLKETSKATVYLDDVALIEK